MALSIPGSIETTMTLRHQTVRRPSRDMWIQTRTSRQESPPARGSQTQNFLCTTETVSPRPWLSLILHRSADCVLFLGHDRSLRCETASSQPYPKFDICPSPR
jgi:hypothetical protein